MKQQQIRDIPTIEYMMRLVAFAAEAFA